MESADHSNDESSMEFGTPNSRNTGTISEIEEENPNEPSEAQCRILTPVETAKKEDVYVVVGKSSSSMEFGTPDSRNTCTISEIEEENPNERSEAQCRILTPVERVKKEDVYVVVGKSSSSIDALVWTLKNGVLPSTFLYLVHVFPEVHHIPTPVGKVPKSQVTPEQVESYLSQEREKRRVMLQKFFNLCTAFKVNVDTVLIESNLKEKAILQLIPVENIRKLVLGTTKSNIRRGSGKAIHIHRKAPDFCGVKIICEGKEVAGDQFSAACNMQCQNWNCCLIQTEQL